MAEASRRELSFPLMPHGDIPQTLEDYLRQLEELLRTLFFGMDSPVFPEDGGAGTFTEGSIIFAGPGGGLTEDNANLFWDDTNNQIGIGTNTPNNRIQVLDFIEFTVTNTALGYQAIESLNGGTHNFVGGYQAGYDLTSANYNTLLGNYAGYDIITGSNNVLIGYQALYKGTTYKDSVIIGYLAGYDNVGQSLDGKESVIVGVQAGWYDPGTLNTFIGFQAGMYNDTSGTGDNGRGCVYVGHKAGCGSSGSENHGYQCTAIGALCLDAQTTGDYNTCLGYAAGHGITTHSNNTFVGWWSGGNSQGSNNAALGYQAGQSLDGGNCVAIGFQAGRAAAGAFGVFIGSGAGYDADNAGANNTVVGGASGYALEAGAGNSFFGRYSGYREKDGNYNVAIGMGALSYLASSQVSNSNNTMLGYYAGTNLTTGSSNIFLGYYVGYNQTTISNLLLIDNQQRAVVGHEAYESILYGVMAATSGAQDLSINADVLIRNDGTMGSESLSEGDFATHADWSVAGDFDDTGGNATYTHSTGAGTLTQASADMAVAGVANKWYKFVFTVSTKTAGFTGATITTAFASSAVTLPVTIGTHTVYFQAAASPGDFVISATSTGGEWIIDNLSLKEMQGGDLEVNGTLTARNFAIDAGTVIGTLDLEGITDGNIPYMSASGFVDSPLSTDATDVEASGDFHVDSGTIRGKRLLIGGVQG